MSNSPKPFRLLLPLGIMLSFLAIGLVFMNLNSASPDQSRSLNPPFAPADIGMRSPHSIYADRARENHSPAGINPVSPDPSVAASLAPNDSGPRVSPAPSEAATAYQAGRAQLMRDLQQLMLQLADAPPEERSQSMKKWHEEHADALAAQQQLAMKMGAASRPPMLRVPPAPWIPDNATPELRELLIARHTAMKDRAEMLAQLQNVSPEERHQAMANWHERNAIPMNAIQTAAARRANFQPPPRHPNH